VREYHAQQLARLFEHVRDGFARFDAGDLDAFGLDALIHRYSRSAKELWKFCGYSESRIPWAVHALDSTRDSATDPDWWELGDPDRRRRPDRQWQLAHHPSVPAQRATRNQSATLVPTPQAGRDADGGDAQVDVRLSEVTAVGLTPR
jgi:hypothetical protein